jgi:hypothetical protein
MISSLPARASRVSRDTVLFTFGLLGVIHETALTDGERIYLLAMFAGMMGLPVFLRKDEKGAGPPPPPPGP